MKRKYIWILFVCVAVGLLLIPYETTLVPRWDFRITDESGAPIPGVVVEQSCHHYTYYNEGLCEANEDARQFTNESGLVSFPERNIQLGAGSRLVRSLIAYPLWLAHGSIGPESYLIIHSPESYEPANQFIAWIPGKSPPGSVVLCQRQIAQQ